MAENMKFMSQEEHLKAMLLDGSYPKINAHWEFVETSPIKKELRCSNCGFHGFRTNYCPICGADMREKSESKHES